MLYHLFYCTHTSIIKYLHCSFCMYVLNKFFPSSHRHIDDCVDESWELIACPGGMPGATNLRDSSSLRTLLLKQSENNKMIGAICASPAVILAHHGLIGAIIFNCLSVCMFAFTSEFMYECMYAAL